MKQIDVTILGQSYVLGCPEGGEKSLLAAVATVDREMIAIRDAGKVRARERIAVLAALNLAYALAQRPSSGGVSGVAATGAVASDASLQPADAQTLDDLIQRVDHALAERGQLL